MEVTAIEWSDQLGHRRWQPAIKLDDGETIYLWRKPQANFKRSDRWGTAATKGVHPALFDTKALALARAKGEVQVRLLGIAQA